MRAEWQDWGKGQIGVRLEASSEELRRLSKAALALSHDTDQHFHISETAGGLSTVGDIEVSVMGADALHTMTMSSFAIPPGAEIPDRKPKSALTWQRARPAVAAVFGAVGVFETLGAISAGLVTVAGTDYRPILTQGAWGAVTAVIAFQVSALVARGWRGRALALVGTLAAVHATLFLFGRFGALVHGLGFQFP